MAVQQRQAGLVGEEVDVHSLVTAEHGDVLRDAGSGRACDMGDFKGVPVQVHRVDVVGGVAEPQPVPLAVGDVEYRLGRLR